MSALRGDPAAPAGDLVADGLSPAGRAAAGARGTPAAQEAALILPSAASLRSVAWLWGVTDNRLQRLADRVVPTADPTWWDPPGDLVLSLDEHSFGGQDWRVTVARRAPDRR